ncbi:MAG: tetratricopeptide repeat protein [Nitrospirota bacterium]|nr:tetratricopeptide repeat protein [Nitrospirota bacterium]
MVFPLIFLLAALMGAGCAALPEPGSLRGGGRTALKGEIQAWLLQHAHEHYAQGRYTQAVHVLRRLIEAYPRSPLLVEARWWLARSYEQAGERRAALDEYRAVQKMVLTGRTSKTKYGVKARARITALEEALGSAASRAGGLVAIQLPSREVPDTMELGQWVESLAQAGIRMIILDTGTTSAGDQRRVAAPRNVAHQGASAPGVYFRTSWAMLVRDVFGQVVPVAHRHGVMVFAAIPLRQLDWLDSDLGWSDQAFDPDSRQFRRLEFQDLFDPAFQEYLTGLLLDLAKTGVDGVLFRATAPSGPLEGMTAFGLRGFEQDFDTPLSPEKLAGQADRSGMATHSRQAGAPEQNVQAYPPQFWRWTGWKARETVNVMERLRRALVAQSPNLEFALEVHPESITDPVTALVQYGEDLLEAKRSRFDFYLAGPVSPPPVMSTTSNSSGTASGEALDRAAIVDRMIELIGEPGRVWVAIPLPTGDRTRLWDRVQPDLDRARFNPDVGLIYMVDPLSLP